MIESKVTFRSKSLLSLKQEKGQRRLVPRINIPTERKIDLSFRKLPLFKIKDIVEKKNLLNAQKGNPSK